MAARRRRTTVRRRKTYGAHRAIRRSCKTCKHKPAQLRRNPSLHNHHGLCSFKRYHKSYCRRHTCRCQKLTRRRY
jgi:hypothetical protein